MAPQDIQRNNLNRSNIQGNSRYPNRPSYIPRPPAVYQVQEYEDFDRQKELEDESQIYYERYEDQDAVDSEDRLDLANWIDGPADDNEISINHVRSASAICQRCQSAFPSNNKLHRHIRSDVCSKISTSKLAKGNTVKKDNIPKVSANLGMLIESDAPSDRELGFGFRKWHYMEVQIHLSQSGAMEFVCLDSGCTMSLIDGNFPRIHAPNQTIQKLSKPINVRGIRSVTHTCTEFVTLDVYFTGTLHGQLRTARIRRDFHIVKDLKARMLLGMDVISPERINTNITDQSAKISSCQNLKIPLSITPRSGGKVKRVVRIREKTVIEPHTMAFVKVKLAALPHDRDFSFHPEYNGNTEKLRHQRGIYAHIVDANMSYIQVRNDGICQW